jgi:hypothetical protein
MDSRTVGRPGVAVVMTDSELLDQVLSLTAVVGVEPLLLSDASLVRPHWSSAAMVLLGIEQADRVAAMGLPRRAGVYLVAEDRTAPQGTALVSATGRGTRRAPVECELAVRCSRRRDADEHG